MAKRAGKGLWRVTVEEKRCSLCGACAQWCAPGALTLQQLEGRVTLRFAADRCPGCALCVPPCPEDAIQLTQGCAPAVAGAADVLASSELARCVRCGVPSVPTKMLGSLTRWFHQLEPHGEPAAEDYATCDACRSDMMFTGGALHA